MIAQVLMVWLTGLWCGFSWIRKSEYGTPATEFVTTWIFPMVFNGILYLGGFYDCFGE